MSYRLIPFVIFLAVLLAGGIGLIADGGIRLLRGQRR
jgi:hypothetical protein